MKTIDEILRENNFFEKQSYEYYELAVLIKSNLSKILKLWDKLSIHKDFIIEWEWKYNNLLFNKKWDLNKGTPDFKISFCFDDTRLLDNCPYVCKIWFNLKWSSPMFFGVVYGQAIDFIEISGWIKKFSLQQLKLC